MTPLFSPPSTPFAGMRTDPRASLSLGPGEWALVDGLRSDGGLVVARKGHVKLLDPPNGVGAFAGAWAGTIGGATVVVAGFVVSGRVALYSTSLSSPAWTEITTTAGYGGNTRFATASALDLEFALVKVGTAGGIGGSPREVLLIQNGTDAPRVWDPVAAYAGGRGVNLWIHQPIVTPTKAENVSAKLTLSSFVPIAGVSQTFTNTSATQCGVGYPASGGYSASAQKCVQVAWNSAGATTVGGGTNLLLWTWPAGIKPGRQMVAVVECSAADLAAFLASFTIDLYGPTGPSHQYVYTPPTVAAAGDSGFAQALPIDSGNNRWVLTWDTSSVVGSPDTIANGGNVYGIRFQYVYAQDSTSRQITFLTLGFGGDWSASSQFGIAYEDRYTLAEGPGLVTAGTKAAKLSELGGPALVTVGGASTATAAAPSMRTDDTTISYDVQLSVLQPIYSTGSATFDGSTASGLNGMPSSVAVYARPSPAGSYQYLGSAAFLAPHTGAPTWDYSTVAARRQAVWSFSFASQFPGLTYASTDPQRTLPTAYNTCVPTARRMLVANGRLFAGNVVDATSATQAGDLYFSAFRLPLRFQANDLDTVNGGRSDVLGSRVSLPGTLTALANAAAAADGASFVFAWSDGAFYRLGPLFTASTGSGFETQRLEEVELIAPTGTLSPRSVVVERSTLFWLDQNRRFVRYVAGSPQDLSFARVRDRFEDVPASRVSSVQAAFLADRVHVGYSTASSTANDRALGFHTRLLEGEAQGGVWEFDDTAPGLLTYERLLGVTDPLVGRRLLCLSAGGTLYALEESATELGAPTLSFTLRTGEVRIGASVPGRGPQSRYLGAVWVHADAQVGRYWQTDRAYPTDGSSWGSSLSMTPTGTRSRVSGYDETPPVETTATLAPQGDDTAVLTISGQVAPGSAIYGLFVDVAGQTGPSGTRP